MDTITVLGDYETWNGDDGIVAIVTDSAIEDMVERDIKFKRLADNQIVAEVSIRSLLDLWNKTYGTSF
jgi:hypothetical protein